MQIRNALIILAKLTESFPVVRKIGLALEAKVTKLKDEESREDLKVLATRYHAMLQAGKPKWLAEVQVHAMPKAEGTANSAGPTPPASAQSTPQLPRAVVAPPAPLPERKTAETASELKSDTRRPPLEDTSKTRRRDEVVPISASAVGSGSSAIDGDRHLKRRRDDEGTCMVVFVNPSLTRR